MGKLNVTLPEVNQAAPKLVNAPSGAVVKEELLEDMTAGLPSPAQAHIDKFRRAKRTTWTFTSVPVPIKQQFEEEAKRRGIPLKAFFYECLRAQGIEIPPYEELDGRKL